MIPEITNSINPPVHYLTKRELADRWRLTTRTLERWRAQGQGPASYTIGTAIRYRLEDVEAFEADNRQRSGG